jgi:type II secretory pathway pseudopilin PulG
MPIQPAAAASKQRLIILGSVLVLALAIVGWRLAASSGGSKAQTEAEVAERALQEQIEREGLTATPPPDENAPPEEPVKTRAATRLDGQ